MNTKLTLRLNKDVIERAKIIAKKQNKSLSDLVENYFQLLIMNKSTSIAPSGSITSELSGLLKDIAIDDIDKTIADHLTEKYS